MSIDDEAYGRRRRALLLSGLNDLRLLTGLEIGPLAAPIVEKADGRIFYVDHCSTAELRTKYARQVSFDLIRDVDFVWNGQPLIEAVGGRQFDYVIASHVIEHAPNLVGWISEVSSILKDEGQLCLAIPDKRYTFDVARPLSTLGEIVEAHLSNRKVPSLKQVYDNYTLARSVDRRSLWCDNDHKAKSLWPENYRKSTSHRYLHPRGIVWDFVQKTQAGEYVDCHCWIFTPRSFLDVLEALAVNQLVQFGVSAFHDTLPNQHEFIVRLRKEKSISQQLSTIKRWTASASGEMLDTGIDLD